MRFLEALGALRRATAGNDERFVKVEGDMDWWVFSAVGQYRSLIGEWCKWR